MFERLKQNQYFVNGCNDGDTFYQSVRNYYNCSNNIKSLILSTVKDTAVIIYICRVPELRSSLIINSTIFSKINKVFDRVI